jgi:hypothetical protein
VRAWGEGGVVERGIGAIGQKPRCKYTASEYLGLLQWKGAAKAQAQNR